MANTLVVQQWPLNADVFHRQRALTLNLHFKSQSFSQWSREGTGTSSALLFYFPCIPLASKSGSMKNSLRDVSHLQLTKTVGWESLSLGGFSRSAINHLLSMEEKVEWPRSSRTQQTAKVTTC